MKTSFKTDALARFLTLQAKPFVYQPEPEPAPDQIEAATARLDALPKADQIVLFCKTMGFNAFEFLSERARYASEAEHDIFWLDLSDCNVTHASAGE